MNSTIDFVRRHKNKIAAGAVIAVGACYGAKRLLESTSIGDFVRQPFSILQSTDSKQRDECLLNEERIKLMIEMNQQACDKILFKIAAQLKVKIDETFDTDSLLHELSTPEIDSKRKIEIWESLKVISVAKVFSSLTIFPLLTVVVKIQRTILCQIACSELLRNVNGNEVDVSSVYSSGMRLLKSFFYDDFDSYNNTNNFDTTTSTNINLNKNIQIIFCDSIQYLLTEGLQNLLKIIEEECQEIFSKINLAEKLNFMDFHFLMEQVIVKIKKLGEEKNFSNFVVPKGEKLNLSSLHPLERQSLEDLFSQLLSALHSEQCRILIDELFNKYFDNVLKFLDEILIEGTLIPYAKLIPKICQLYGFITSINSKNSLFSSILICDELQQFVQFIMEKQQQQINGNGGGGFAGSTVSIIGGN